MSWIINIDTSTSLASVSLAKDGVIISSIENNEQKQHASFVQPAISSILDQYEKEISSIDAIAVTIGPGSYTGLRVGLSSAKGICYALNIPLITESTLKIMAYASMHMNADYYCPMIDARRMEVFTALFDPTGKLLLPEQPMVLDAGSFQEFLAKGRILFLGDGVNKWQELLKPNDNALFEYSVSTINVFAELSYKKFQQKDFADLAYTEPSYLKGFHS